LQTNVPTSKEESKMYKKGMMDGWNGDEDELLEILEGQQKERAERYLSELELKELLKENGL
jgi:hypothetical protein